MGRGQLYPRYTDDPKGRPLWLTSTTDDNDSTTRHKKFVGHMRKAWLIVFHGLGNRPATYHINKWHRKAWGGPGGSHKSLFQTVGIIGFRVGGRPREHFVVLFGDISHKITTNTPLDWSCTQPCTEIGVREAVLVTGISAEARPACRTTARKRSDVGTTISPSVKLKRTGPPAKQREVR